MPAEVLCGRMHDHIRAPGGGAHQDGRREGVVYDDERARAVSDCRERRAVRQMEERVGDGLEGDEAWMLALHRLLHRREIEYVHEGCMHAEAREVVLQQR